MTGADFAMQTQSVSSATVFARKDIMEMANRAKVSLRFVCKEIYIKIYQGKDSRPGKRLFKV